MDKVPKDVVELITNKLTPREFFNYCKSETGQEFCARKEIWLRRIQKDFGLLLEGRNKDRILANHKTDPKKSYLELFLHTSQAAEELKEKVLQNIGNPFLRFVKDEYWEVIFDFFFDYLLEMINVLEIATGDTDNSIRVLAQGYSWQSPRKWHAYLPKLYNTELSDFWEEEIGEVLANYAIEIFNP